MSVTETSDPTSDGRRGRAGARSRQQTRLRLRDAGMQLFAERGLHRLTTHDIARRAGVASGTYYLHFADKQSLFREIALEAVAALRERVEQALGSAHGLGVEAERRAHAAALIDFAEDNRPLIHILFSGDADAAVVEADILNMLAESIAKGRGEHGVPAGMDATVLSQALVGMYARVLAWWVADPRRVTREQVIETLTRIQLSGTLPDSAD